MAQATKIEWTDKTWNPTTGCTRVSEGCRNCYAFALHDQRHAAHKAGKKVPQQYAKPFTELQVFPDRLTDPLSWRKPCRVFVNSMSDLFHKDIPDEFLADVFAIMARCQQHTFQVLTKRPERMLEFCSKESHWRGNKAGIADKPYYMRPLPNVWLGVSVEDQKRADERIPELLKVPAAVRFLSCEPLLSALDLSGWLGTRLPSEHDEPHNWPADGIRWVIVGGESGPGARPCHVGWVRGIVRQCEAAGVSCFVKQLGGNVRDRNDAGFMGDPGDAWDLEPFSQVEHDPDGVLEEYQGAPVRVRLADRKGGDMAEWPVSLRVRQFPGGEG